MNKELLERLSDPNEALRRFLKSKLRKGIKIERIERDFFDFFPQYKMTFQASHYFSLPPADSESFSLVVKDIVEASEKIIVKGIIEMIVGELREESIIKDAEILGKKLIVSPFCPEDVIIAHPQTYDIILKYFMEVEKDENKRPEKNN